MRPRPRYLQIADDLRAGIQSGEYPPETRLPGMIALARRYGVGTGVVQQAVRVLEREGLVIRRPRGGSWVRPVQDRPQRIELGRTVRRDELGYLFAAPGAGWVPVAPPTREWVPCPEDVAELLSVEPASPVLMRRRVVGQDGRPLQLTTTYLPEWVARGTVLEQADTGPGGYLDRLEQDMGHGPLSWTATLCARLPSREEAEALAVAPALPVLVTTRVAISAQRQPVAVDQAVVDAQRFCIGWTITRAPSARWPVSPATDRNGVTSTADTNEA